MTRRNLLLGLLLLFGAYLATTLIPESTMREDGTLKKVPCWFDDMPGWVPECYRLTVPESRQTASDRTTQLPVIVLRSPTHVAGRAPVLHIMGGPGQPAYITQSAEMNAWAGFLSGAAWTLDRDHILYDSRGVGPLATPQLRCALLSDLNWSVMLDELGEGTPEWQAAYEKSLQFCRDGLAKAGTDLSAYNTIEAAADMVALRKALGVDRWVPYGVSYGTRVALQLMRTDPDGIEAVVLDSVYPLHIRGWADSLPVLDRRLKDLFDACHDQDDCRHTYGNLDTMLARVMKRINDSPVPLTLRDERSDRTVDLKADGDDLITVLEYALLMSDWLEYIPLLIDQMDHKDYQLFTIAAEQIVFDDYFDTDANGLTYSTQCHEEMAVNPPEAFAAGRDAFPFPTATDFELILRLACRIWDVGDVDPSFLEPVESDIPTLILSGAYDPRTPYEWAMEQVERLKNGHLALLLNAGHGPSVTDACAQAAMTAFLDSPENYMPPGCLNRQGATEFLAAPGPPDMVL